MSRHLTMTEVAAEVGISYDRFRKVWQDLVVSIGLPMPFAGRRWDADAVAIWKRDRSARTPPAPHRRDAVAGDARATKARAQLDALRVD